MNDTFEISACSVQGPVSNPALLLFAERVFARRVVSQSRLNSRLKVIKPFFGVARHQTHKLAELHTTSSVGF